MRVRPFILLSSRVSAKLHSPRFIRVIKLGEIDAEELSGIRRRAIKEMTAYEMGLVRAYFGT